MCVCAHVCVCAHTCVCVCVFLCVCMRARVLEDDSEEPILTPTLLEAGILWFLLLCYALCSCYQSE